MISNQTIKLSIDKLKTVTKIDFSVRNMEGYMVASTARMEEISMEAARQYVADNWERVVKEVFRFD